MDIALTYDGDRRFDLALSGADLASESGMRAAVIVSLFSDRRAERDDVLPGAPHDTDRRGWWADAWPEVSGDRIGSRLWLLSREKQTADVLQRARGYAEEALAWLVEDGAALAVEVDAEWVRAGLLGLRAGIRLADGSRWSDVFEYPLEVL